MNEEDYVSFETAKLLKEKGFNEKTKYFFNIIGFTEEGRDEFNWNEGPYYAKPSLYDAIKWLRKEYDLHITVYPWRADKEEKACHWCCKVYKTFNLFGYDKYTNETVKSYEEGCDIAIKYCLEKLI